MSAILQCIAMYLKITPYRHGGAGRAAGLLPANNSQQLHVEPDVDAEFFNSDGDEDSVSADGDRDSDDD